jgi:hypothetical protein
VTSLEDRLREAYGAVTDPVREDDLPGLYPRHRTRRRARFGAFAPLAAAAAVVAAIGIAVAVPRLASSPGRPAVPAAPGAEAAAPPFALILNRPDSRGDQGPLVVVSAATGRVTGRVPDPRRGTTWYDAAPAGSGTRFVLAATPARGGGLCKPTYLYTLTLSASGASASLTPWTVPVVHAEIGSIAASADGSTVAFAAAPCHSPDQQIGVIRGQTVKTWQEPALLSADSLSLSADGSALGYAESGAGQGTVRVLDTRSAAGSATAASKIVYTYPIGARAPSVTLGAAGTTMYVYWMTGPGGLHLTGTLAGYRIGPGGVQGTLFRRTMPAGLSVSRAGGQVLAWGQGVALYLADPVTGKATRVRAAWTDSWQIFW